MGKTKEVTEKIEKIKEENNVYKNWSLKKKILVGLGVLGAAAVGVVAYSKSTEEDLDNEDVYDEDEDEYGYNQISNYTEEELESPESNVTPING